MGLKKTTKEIKQKIYDRFGDSLIYDKLIYTGCLDPIVLTCPIHGDFERHLCNLMRSPRGCPECSQETRRMGIDVFVSRAKECHENFYTYGNVTEYKSNDTKVPITCPKHGDFMQSPDKHLGGQGCPLCGYGNISKRQLMSIDEFLQKARNTHGDEYDYSLVKITPRDKIKIICKTHGIFKQTRHDHISGNGCQKCGLTKRPGSYNETNIDGYRNVEGMVYHVLLDNGTNRLEKIGISRIDLDIRMRSYTRKGYTVTVLDELNCDMYFAFNLEQKILEYLDSINERYMYVDLKDDIPGWTECFIPDFFSLSDFYQDHLDFPA